MTTAPLAAPERAIARRAAALRTGGAPARLAAFVPLCLLGLLSWSTLLAGRAGAGPWAMALAVGGAAFLLSRLPAPASPRRRLATLTGAGAGLLVAALLTAGVDAALLWPRRWDELVAGIADGLLAVPGIASPYRGADSWVQATVLLGGGLLAATATLQAFWPVGRGSEPAAVPDRGRLASPVPAAMTLALLWGIAIVEVPPERPLLTGALFALLLAAFLFADRIAAAQAAPAAICVATATVLAIALAPAVDAGRPWIDLEQISDDVANTGTTGYRWDHSYAPLQWPREGRELLRVKAQASAYWKAQVLDSFDGRGWLRSEPGRIAPYEPDGETDEGHPEWQQTIDVRVRGLRSEQYVTAGSAISISDELRRAVRVSGGTFVPQRGILRRGTRYSAAVYTPAPNAGELGRAGSDYPSQATLWLSVGVPDASGAPSKAPADRRPVIGFAPFGSDAADTVTTGYRTLPTYDAEGAIRGTGLERSYALAQRLLAGAENPYEYVKAVLARVRSGATYTEDPGTARNPLDRFLFDDRRGYCQHFSGAMALLLRMGGVPARVAVGFAPGTLDESSDEYVVRDVDAHSWVEVLFPRYGWVTFDPTPAAAPAREQSADIEQELGLPRGAEGPGGDRQSDPTAGGTAALDSGSGLPIAGLVLGALLIAGLLASAIAAVHVRRRAGGASGPPELRELERALRICGRPAPAAATLRDLERALGAGGDARGYLRALADQRFAPQGAGPTAAQRRALRRELAGGLGRAGQLRAWLALPPRPLRG